MNSIISFAGLKNSRSRTPYALQTIAGGTILGHILFQLLELPHSNLLLIVDSGEEQVGRWVQENVPDLALHILLAGGANDPVDALHASKDLLNSEPLLFAAGNYIAEADFQALSSSEAGVCCLVQPEQNLVPAETLKIDQAGFIDVDGEYAVRWAGSCWFRQGTDLVKALEAVEGQKKPGLGPLLSYFNSREVPISTRRAVICLDTRSEESLLHANARLLGLGHGTQDAIERSYAEDFTVLPPVFLHESAVIENSVIGPFVNLEANARVHNSIVSNSLIGTESIVSNVVLSDSLIGNGVMITGQISSLVASDGAKIIIAEQ